MKKANLYKIGRLSTIVVLTLGASLTLGLLSMSGFMAVYPMVSLGIACFGLSVMFEGEIYFANLVDGLKRLLDRNYHKLEHTKRFLDLIIKQKNVDELPDILKEYQELKKQVEHDEHAHHEHENTEAKKRLALIEEYCMRALFYEDSDDKSPFYLALQAYLNSVCVEEDGSPLDKSTLLLQESYRSKWTNRAFYLSMVTGAFFGFGTLYLLAEAVTVLAIPAATVAILPYVFVPLCLLSGLAYGLLIYNTTANIIQNDTLNKWAKEIKEDFMQKPSPSSITRGVGAVVLIGLGIALTLFTAGTWWTVANNIQKAFPFLNKVPKVIPAVFVPFFTGIGALLFNTENTRESMSLTRPKKEKPKEKSKTRKKPKTSFAEKLKNKIQQQFIIPLKELRSRERFFQFYNPFRFIIYLVESPIKALTFIGHIISIGATTDQIPWVNQSLVMALGGFSEGLEDIHYFKDIFYFFKKLGSFIANSIGFLVSSLLFSTTQQSQEEEFEEEENEGESHHDHHHEHCNHSHNLPGTIVKLGLSPLFLLSTLWNWAFSDNDDFASSWKKSWNHHWLPKEEHDHHHHEEKKVPQETIERQNRVSYALAKMQLKEQSEHYTNESEKGLVYQELMSTLEESEAEPKHAISECVTRNQAILSKHRHHYRFFEPETTTSEDFVKDLRSTLAYGG